MIFELTSGLVAGLRMLAGTIVALGGKEEGAQFRALGVQARTLEIYAKLGLADRAIELGKPGRGANIWSEGRQVGHVSFGDAGAASGVEVDHQPVDAGPRCRRRQCLPSSRRRSWFRCP